MGLTDGVVRGLGKASLSNFLYKEELERDRYEVFVTITLLFLQIRQYTYRLKLSARQEVDLVRCGF